MIKSFIKWNIKLLPKGKEKSTILVKEIVQSTKAYNSTESIDELFILSSVNDDINCIESNAHSGLIF